MSGLPNENERLRTRALELRYQVGRSLMEVLKKYDDLAKSGQPIAELEGEIQTAVTEIHDWLRDGLGEGSADQWLENFEDAVAGSEIGRQLDRQYNNARMQVTQVFSRIDQSLESSVSILWEEIAASLRQRLTEHVIPDRPETKTVLAEFASTADSRGLRTLASATNKLLALKTDYGNIFLRVGRPITREIGCYHLTSGGSSIAAAAASSAVGEVVGHAASSVARPIVGAAVSSAASSAAREWWNASQGGSRGPDPAPPQSGGDPTAGADARAKYPVAAPEYSKLVSIIEHVTAELEREFRAGAQRAVRVLAAATDLFLFSATGTTGVELEFEKLCEPIQRELWPEDFGQAPAKVAADLAVLQEKTAEAKSAASRVVARASQVRRL